MLDSSVRARVLVAIVALAITGTACDTLLNSLVQSQFDSILGDEGRHGVDPGPPKWTPSSFVNWESPHVDPLDISPDGARLLAVNTPDNSVELFDITGAVPILMGRIPVGLDPVSVRFRTPGEAWVVNHVSDSVSIVDLSTMNVVQTLSPGDEPTDVGFAAGRAFVVCSQLNQVKVYDVANLESGPTTIEIAGEDPRALAVSPNGSKVYVSIFESGNKTTIVPFFVVSDPTGPYRGMNPVPDLVSGLDPNPGSSRPRVSLIVRKDASGHWRDPNGIDWSGLVPWDVHDHDLAVIDARTLAVDYVPSLMNLNMALGVRPDGAVAVVGTDATNDVRFEPANTGRFVHSIAAFVPPGAAAAPSIVDLNPHLATAYSTHITTLPPDQRALSIADPRGIAWSADGRFAFVTGMGSNNVAKIDAAGHRVTQLDVGAGPTGIRFDAGRNRLYVLNKFDASISAVDADAMVESARVPFFDPTPGEIRAGRPFLYDARLTSGLGVTACAACHIDGRMDQLAWDLGNPLTSAKQFDQTCDFILGTGNKSEAHCEDFHPLKGPMTTQTLQGSIGQEPLHWRGDRKSLAEFNPAFVGLDGNDRMLTDGEMASFETFLRSIVFPPNPFRLRDDSLPERIGAGDPRAGRDVFMNDMIDARPNNASDFSIDPLVAGQAMVSCNRCHQLPEGTSHTIVPGTLLIEPQSMKVPHLRNIYEKTGFDKNSKSNNRAYGYTHDGAFASVDEFLRIGVFHFGDGDTGEQKRRDVIAFVTALGNDTHPAVGWTVTLRADVGGSPAMLSNPFAADQTAISQMLKLADDGAVGLVVHGRRDGKSRGFAYAGNGMFQSDRAAETIFAGQLRGPVAAGEELSWMVVPLGSQTRIGIDRDGNGVLDGDE